jgi:hypothetical protein
MAIHPTARLMRGVVRTKGARGSTLWCARDRFRVRCVNCLRVSRQPLLGATCCGPRGETLTVEGVVDYLRQGSRVW